MGEQSPIYIGVESGIMILIIPIYSNHLGGKYGLKKHNNY